MPSSGEPLEVYVDRSLGQTVVPDALRKLGLVTHTELSVYGRTLSGVPDLVWLERAGRRGWVVFTKDSRIRYRDTERHALVAGSVRMFVLAGGNLGAAAQAERFIRNIVRIRRACRSGGPFIYAVQSDKIVRLFP